MVADQGLAPKPGPNPLSPHGVAGWRTMNVPPVSATMSPALGSTLLLTLLLRDEVDLLELPLADLVEESVTTGTDERWDLDASSQLVLLLAAMADL